MSHQFKLASVGTIDKALMGLIGAKMVLWSSGVILLSLIGKLLCLISGTGAGGESRCRSACWGIDASASSDLGLASGWRCRP